VLQNLELTLHEYVRLQSQQVVYVSWNCGLFLLDMSGVGKQAKQTFSKLVSAIRGQR
jgi:hypothetical protein